jgi:hypothetical protein
MVKRGPCGGGDFKTRTTAGTALVRTALGSHSMAEIAATWLLASLVLNRRSRSGSAPDGTARIRPRATAATRRQPGSGCFRSPIKLGNAAVRFLVKISTTWSKASPSANSRSSATRTCRFIRNPT